MKRFFKKIWTKILEIWYLGFRNTLQKRAEYGGFIVDFHQYDMRIRTKSGNFSMKVRASEHTFGYLATALAQGKDENVHGFAVIMYFLACNICKDDKLAREVQRSIERSLGRMEKAPVEEESEEVAIESMKQDIERGQMSRRQRRRAEKAAVKAGKEILKEDKENE